MKKLMKYMRSQSGAELIEYAAIILLVAVIIGAIIAAGGGPIVAMFNALIAKANVALGL